ncbi:hexamerin-like [Periplaneta americana]|uniref:hexamerin-like n=1 Tax=Periplaneta americana TaxID=6978 RepID=UPI0037E7B82B
MRTALALVFAALVALVTAYPGPSQDYKIVADKPFLQRQRDFLRLLVRIQQPNYYSDQFELGNSYDVEGNINNYKNPQVVKQFLAIYKAGMLPRGVPYSPYYSTQRYETKLLFDLFYYANDYDTFYKTACWARDRVNEGQFLYAFSVATFQREDLNDIVLPPPYEIYPYLFVEADVIQKAYETRERDVGLTSPKTYVFPANYTVYNPEQLLNYYREDVGLNTYYAYYFYNYPTFLNETEYGLNFARRGEQFYYTRQQIYARYYLERLSWDLPDVEPYYYDRPFQTAYNPNLRYPNGQEVPVRPYEYSRQNSYDYNGNSYYYGNYYTGNNEYYTGNYYTGNYQPTYYYGYANNYDYYYPEDLLTYEKRVNDAIDYGYFFSPYQGKYPLYEDYYKGINYLGDVIEGNGETVNKRFYGSIYHYYRALAGKSVDPYNNHGLAPSALQNIYTALRDPANYQILKRVNYFFQRYKNYLPRYTYDELVYPGVKVVNVEVSKLITYFDYFDIDLDNVVNVKTPEDGQYVDYRARQTRLNHKPFTYTVDVTSDKAQDVYVRVFLGPKYDYLGREYNINDRRHYFVELDRFPYKVQAGQTTIQRNSRDSYVVTPDYPSYRTLFRKVEDAYQGRDQFYIDRSQRYCGYPERLLLPRGKKGGQAYTFYVIVTPYVQQDAHDFEPYNYKSFSYCGVGPNRKYPDDKPLGYPFDRPIYGKDFYTPNMYFKDVVIFHKKQEEVNAATTH